ncbi:hypothetical protein HDU93_008383 [Gonapodya sp. JEL0774]|nr:hypothetical protein HDU93_008383 [Gonapodya sp. JEL0774]
MPWSDSTGAIDAEPLTTSAVKGVIRATPLTMARSYSESFSVVEPGSPTSPTSPDRLGRKRNSSHRGSLLHSIRSFIGGAGAAGVSHSSDGANSAVIDESPGGTPQKRAMSRTFSHTGHFFGVGGSLHRGASTADQGTGHIAADNPSAGSGTGLGPTTGSGTSTPPEGALEGHDLALMAQLAQPNLHVDPSNGHRPSMDYNHTPLVRNGTGLGFGFGMITSAATDGPSSSTLGLAAASTALTPYRPVFTEITAANTRNALLTPSARQRLEVSQRERERAATAAAAALAAAELANMRRPSSSARGSIDHGARRGSNSGDAGPLYAPQPIARTRTDGPLAPLARGLQGRPGGSQSNLLGFFKSNPGSGVNTGGPNGGMGRTQSSMVLGMGSRSHTTVGGVPMSTTAGAPSMDGRRTPSGTPPPDAFPFHGDLPNFPFPPRTPTPNLVPPDPVSTPDYDPDVPVPTIETERQFEKYVIEGSKTRVVAVMYYAEWCPPCRFLDSKYHTLALAVDPAQYLLTRLSVDHLPSLCAELAVQYTPTTQFWRNGRCVDELVGADGDMVRTHLEGLGANGNVLAEGQSNDQGPDGAGSPGKMWGWRKMSTTSTGGYAGYSTNGGGVHGGPSYMDSAQSVPPPLPSASPSPFDHHSGMRRKSALSAEIKPGDGGSDSEDDEARAARRIQTKPSSVTRVALEVIPASPTSPVLSSFAPSGDSQLQPRNQSDEEGEADGEDTTWFEAKTRRGPLAGIVRATTQAHTGVGSHGGSDEIVANAGAAPSLSSPTPLRAAGSSSTAQLVPSPVYPQTSASPNSPRTPTPSSVSRARQEDEDSNDAYQEFSERNLELLGKRGAAQSRTASAVSLPGAALQSRVPTSTPPRTGSPTVTTPATPPSSHVAGTISLSRSSSARNVTMSGAARTGSSGPRPRKESLSYLREAVAGVVGVIKAMEVQEGTDHVSTGKDHVETKL